MAKQRSALGSIGIFEGVDEKELQRLESVAVRRTFGAGQALVQEGRSGLALYAVTSGSAKVTQRASDGQERELRTLGPGDSFGEMALFSDWGTRLRSATVTAVEPTEALVLEQLDFIAHLRKHPDLAIRLLDTLSRRVVEAEQRAAT